MKQFAIAINSEKEYEKVKAYAEKWGYKEIEDVCQYTGLPRTLVAKDGIYQNQLYHGILTENWKKLIRKNSPLKLENICVRIDTIERVKEVWDIIKDCGVDINWRTREKMNDSVLDFTKRYLICVNKMFIRTNHAYLGKNEITPKQLAQILGVKREGKIEKIYKENVQKGFNNMTWDDLRDEIDKTNKRIDKLAKNYNITESDSLVTKKELKESNSKLRKRMYELEELVLPNPLRDITNAHNNRIDKISDHEKLELPKIAIRVENEQEFNDLTKIYDVLGWVNFGHDRGYVSREFVVACYVEFKNNFSCFNITDDYINPKGSLFIPFSQIKGLK